MILTERNKNLLENVTRITCIVIACSLLAISVLVYGAPIGSLAVLVLFSIIYIQIPGMLLLKWSKLNECHFSTRLAIGTFLGWALSIATYLISDLLRGDVLLYSAGPILSIIYILSTYRESKGIKKDCAVDFSKISVCFYIFMTIILLYCLVNTQYLYLAPDQNELTYMNPDKAYHMGLINSLSHDYPLQSPWINGVYINYHIFSEMMLSIPVRLFDIPSDVVTQSFGPFFTAYCFGISYYSFFREMSTTPKRAGIYTLLVILANIYVTRRASTSIAYTFALINDNSSGYGIAASLMAIISFKKWHESFVDKRENRNRLLLLSAIMIMLTTGIKGPMGAVVIAGIWGTVVLGIILRKVSPKLIFPMLVLTAGFLLVYLTILGSKGQSNASGSSIIAFAKIADIAFWKKPLVSFLKGIGVPKIIRLLLLLVVFMMFFLTAFFIPFCIGYVRELVLVIIGRKDYEPARVLVYAGCAAGLVAMFMLNYSGHSQIYFGLLSAFLAPMIAFWFIEDLERKQDCSRLSKHLLRTSILSVAVIIVMTTISLGYYFDRHIKDAIRNASPETNADKYLSISNEEYDAMEWVEENTEKDALLATDRYYSVDLSKYSYENRWDNRFFLYGVYSNRFILIGGSGYNMRQADWLVRKEMIETNEKLYDEDNESRGDLARELGVDYVVVSKRFSGNIELENKDYELCYTNPDIDIYKIAE